MENNSKRLAGIARQCTLTAIILGAILAIWIPRFHATSFGILIGRVIYVPLGLIEMFTRGSFAGVLMTIAIILAVIFKVALLAVLGLWLGTTLERSRPAQPFRIISTLPASLLLVTITLLFIWPTPSTFLTPADRLINASAAGNTAQIQELTRSGVDVNSKDKRFGQSALHVAVQMGKVDVVRSLLDAGADVNRGDQYGFTPLECALNGYDASPAIVGLLLERGARVGITQPYHSSPLCSMAEKGNITVAQMLLEHGADINARSANGHLPLCQAVYYGRKDMVLFFIKNGAHLNDSEADGTPLMIAANNIDQGVGKELCRILLDAGADVNAATPNGDTALMRAAHGKKADVLKLLLSKGADPNASTKFGVTPLYEAVSRNNAENVKALVEGGADMNKPCLGGKTPLQIAKEDEKDDALTALEEAQKTTAHTTLPATKG